MHQKNSVISHPSTLASTPSMDASVFIAGRAEILSPLPRREIPERGFLGLLSARSVEDPVNLFKDFP
jgi:hypothetical protein